MRSVRASLCRGRMWISTNIHSVNNEYRENNSHAVCHVTTVTMIIKYFTTLSQRYNSFNTRTLTLIGRGGMMKLYLTSLWVLLGEIITFAI